MIDCPIYYVIPGATGDPSPPVDDVVTCGGCNCGYLQYEELIPYLKEIQSKAKEDAEDYTQFEFRLRQQILEVSRLFDMEAGVSPGYFAKGHYKTTKLYTSNGGKYIKIPEFILGTLEVRTVDDVIVDDSTYGYENQHLVYLPCMEHLACGCNDGCGNTRVPQPYAWPNRCYKVSAKWGKDCADVAVKMAVRDYLIETYRTQDPIHVVASGLPVQTFFRVPHSWETYMKNFKQRNKFFSQWAIA
jgi:hypothetical protein